MPPLMSNHGNYIVSLGQLCRWLAQQAEALGVEIYPGFAAVDAELGPGGEVTGIVTGDMGVARDGHHKANYTPGMELRGKYTLIAEGARGSLAKTAHRALWPRRRSRAADLRPRPQGIVGAAEGEAPARAL